ncbi:hypothetical protein ACFX2G_015139 [Malus domestica]
MVRRWKHIGSGLRGLSLWLWSAMRLGPALLGQRLRTTHDGSGSVALWCGPLAPPSRLLVHLLFAYHGFAAMELAHSPLP